jgi:hypothetical protein
MAKWKVATENLSSMSELKHTSIKDVFNATKRGSKNYKKILLSKLTVRNIPGETNWNRYNIPIPDMEEEGEKVLYFFKQDCKWTERRTYIFISYTSTISTTAG